MGMDLPVYEMVINPDEASDVEVSFVALVDKPAIERNFMAFNSQRLDFAVNDEKRIISGPAMVSDQLIYRKDQNGEYNVFFSPETVRDIALKFFKKDYQKNLNLFHDPSLSLEGVTIFESFVSDKSRGIQPMKGFEDLPDGSWFISAKVENNQVWDAIKSGQVKGFSVEGIFSFMKLNRPVSNSSHFNTENNLMSELKDLWAKFKDKFLGETPAPEKLSQEVTLKDGTVVEVDKLEVGGIALIGGAPATAGVHELMDGTKITVAEGGVIEAVEAAMSQEPEKPVDQYAEQFTALNEKLSRYEQDFSAHVTAYNNMAQEFAAQKEQIKNLVELVGKIIETPSAESVQGDNSQFSTQKATRQEKLKELTSIFQSFKKK